MNSAIRLDETRLEHQNVQTSRTLYKLQTPLENVRSNLVALYELGYTRTVFNIEGARNRISQAVASIAQRWYHRPVSETRARPRPRASEIAGGISLRQNRS